MTTVDIWAGRRADHPLAGAERLFRTMAVERLDTLSSAWVRLDSGQNIREALDDIRMVAHKIAGTAASLGHGNLGNQAAEVERLSIEGAGRTALLKALRPLIAGLAELLDD
ncbi:MAG: Hpt domain-containing protein [Fuscovulum sp.]|jgi:HPt (histidine-containing phosphotransfer) domain-containing protein|nr:Hpt domain-containing protein [Paracoccaceae bacterium]MCZ8081837.1 Hpt domain-containing protein [Paracoccaceae bacterium]WRH63103.1 MAG: Hpt domain-containing protein [Fuscovulum sp.]